MMAASRRFIGYTRNNQIFNLNRAIGRFLMIKDIADGFMDNIPPVGPESYSRYREQRGRVEDYENLLINIFSSSGITQEVGLSLQYMLDPDVSVKVYLQEVKDRCDEKIAELMSMLESKVEAGVSVSFEAFTEYRGD